MAAAPRIDVTPDGPRSAEIAGYLLSEGVHAAGSRLPWHIHEGATICLGLSGAFTEISRGSVVTCSPATVKFLPAGEPHCNRFDYGDTRGFMIEVPPERVAAMPSEVPILDERVQFEGGAVPALAQRVYQEFRAMDDAAPLAIEGLLLELLALASRQNGVVRGSPPRWLRDAEARLRAEPAVRWSLDRIAREVGVHPVTLARGFRRCYGCTMGEYVRRLRIEQAASELSTTDLPLAKIALAAGFADQSHFSNLFRRHTGMSPSQYRKVAVGR